MQSMEEHLAGKGIPVTFPEDSINGILPSFGGAAATGHHPDRSTPCNCETCMVQCAEWFIVLQFKKHETVSYVPPVQVRPLVYQWGQYDRAV